MGKEIQMVVAIYSRIARRTIMRYQRFCVADESQE